MADLETSTYRPSYVAAAIASAVVFALYLVTLGPSTAMWDTSEYIAAAYTLGIPHPPGNPFFVLLGRVFTILPIAPNVAMRVNLLAAICSALTAGFWFLVAERVLSSWFAERWQRIAGGALAALVGATAFTVWAQSVVNEKVYTVSLFGLALVSWLLIRWIDNPDGPRADKLLVLAAFLTGLGYANHMAGFLTLPAMGLVVVMFRPRTLLRGRLLLACVGALVLGLTPFATQPIRAAHHPAINEGETTGCMNGLKVGCTLTGTTWDRFKYNFDREQYGKLPLTQRQAPFTAQVEMWWMYFKWQWLRDPSGENSGAQGALAAVFFAIGLLGAWVHYQRDRKTFAYFASLMFTLTFVLIYYLNFKYGASQPPVTIGNELREVRDRDYFYLWSFSAWSVWVALGLMYLWESIASLIEPSDDKAAPVPPTRSSWAMAAPVLALAFVPLFANWTSASRRGDTDTADFARDMLNSVEPYGILVTAGDNDMFPLWYAQEVEGVRRDVLVVNTSLMGTDWFVRQMQRRDIYEYNPDTGPVLYRGKTWKKPSGPPLKLTMDEADAVPAYEEIRQPMEFVAGELKATVAPGYLERSDNLIYRLILDNPERTLHFARSTYGLAEKLGFNDYVIGHGLTLKLSRKPVQATDTVKPVPTHGWVDIAATKALWESFDAPASLIRKNRWIDPPSANVPLLYVATGIALRDSMLLTGDVKNAQSVLDRTRAVATAIGWGPQFQNYMSTTSPLGDTAR
ncbi:MAG TPA: DUF2723 domain-containing protein [Gemmatimonadaceae bacterium]|nr:DUF2723 domain-containing protein [Gemmatimonadaceae bacterium]